MGTAVRWQEAPESQDVGLSIYHAGLGGHGEPSAEWRLSELYERYLKPVHLVVADARPRNVEEIEQSLKYWVRFTGDPPLREIVVWHNHAFVVGLKGLPGRKYATLANNTIRKHCGAIQAMLDLCGPPSREHRGGLALLPTVPYLARPPREDKEAEDCYTLAELQRLVEHADAAEQPRRIGGQPIAAGDYYRRIYALIFNTGMRIGGIMGATWRNFHTLGGGAYLVLPARIAAKGRVGKRVELNAQAVAIIEAMRGFDAERIFPWPKAWPGSRHNLYARGHDLIRQCLPPHRRAFLAFHALRKLHTNELAAINGLACMKSLGHTTARTTVEHYTSRTVVAQAVARLPAVALVAERQRRLFD